MVVFEVAVPRMNTSRRKQDVPQADVTLGYFYVEKIFPTNLGKKLK